ncbi:MAG: response regulator transcription factor [Syntrophorhabdaceae bacterium]|nr:response regulator transcription factor [Syntrophorhabdaceae bacterium]
MAKYVSAGLERAILNQKVKKVEDVINAVCPDLPYNWVIVLDECLEPIYINGEGLRGVLGAEIEVAQKTGVYPHLPEPLEAKCREFSEAARKSTDPMRHAVINCENGVSGQGISANIRSVRSEDSRLLFVVVGDARTKPSEALKKSGLSRREMEIAGLICEGLKNREIGEKLFISEYTVENHLRSIYQKMDVSNRTSLVNRITFARNER